MKIDRKTKPLRNLTFREVILVSFAVFILMTIVCTAVIYSSTINPLKSSRYDVLLQLSEHTADISNSTVYITNKLTTSLLPALLDVNHDNEQCQQLLSSLVSDDINLLESTGLSVDVTIIMRNGEIYSTNPFDDYMTARINNIQTSFWYITNFTNNSSSFWTALIDDVRKQVFFKITYGFAIRGNDGEYKGVILTSINDRILDNLGTFFSENNNIMYILDNEGKAIAHSINSLTSTNLYYMPAFVSEYGYNTSNVINRTFPTSETI